MHPSFVLLIVAGGLAAGGLASALLARALPSPLRPDWPSVTGRWQPWSPIGRQEIHDVVEGVVHVGHDGSSRRGPRLGTAQVRYDPLEPSRSVVDGEIGVGDALQMVAIACWSVAAALSVVAAALPFVIAHVRGLGGG